MVIVLQLFRTTFMTGRHRIQPLTKTDLDISWRTWQRQLLQRKAQRVQSRFTITKMRRLFLYSQETTLLRRVAVLLLFPFPGLLFALATSLIPLQSPPLGVFDNEGFTTHFFVTMFVSMLGTTIQMRAATGLNHDELSNLDVFGISFVAMLLLLGVMIAGGYFWRFPIPFFWVTGAAPWMFCLFLGHILVLRNRLSASSRLRSRILVYAPSLILQISQIVIYHFIPHYSKPPVNGSKSLLLCYFQPSSTC